MTKEVNIHIKAKDTEESKRKIQEVGQATESAGRQVEKGGKDGAKGLDEMNAAASRGSGAFGKFFSDMMNWVRGAVTFATTLGAATAAIKRNIDAIEEHGETAARQQNRLTRLQYLGEYFRENPDLRKEVAAYAEYGKRPFEEVADAWYNLRSKSGSLTKEQQSGIMKEALELGRTDPGAPLDMLVDMFSLFAKKSGQTDINRIQNVLYQTITEAGGSTADVAKYMPMFLPIGMAGGLSPAESAGLWSYATTQSAEASIATTALRAVFMGLQGKGQPEGKEILDNLGISTDMSFFQQIAALSAAKQSGAFGLPQAEQLVGREGAEMLLTLINNPQSMLRTITSVTAADRGDTDISANMIKDLLGTDSFARMEEEGRGLDVELQNIKGSSEKNLQFRTNLKKLEVELRKRGKSEAYIAYHTAKAKFDMAFGYDSLTGMLYDLGQSASDSPSFGKHLMGEDYDTYKNAAMKIPLGGIPAMLNPNETPGETFVKSFLGVQKLGTVYNFITNRNVVYHRPQQPAAPRVDTTEAP